MYRSSGFVLAFLWVFSTLLLTVIAPSVSFGRARFRAATRGAVVVHARNNGIFVPTGSTGGNTPPSGSSAASGPPGSKRSKRPDASGGPSTPAGGSGARGGSGPRGPGSGGPTRTGGGDDDEGEGRKGKRASHKDREVVASLQNVTNPAELIRVVSGIELPESGKIQLITRGFNDAKIKETVTNKGVPLTREEWREVVDQVQRENPAVAVALASATLGAKPASQVKAINALVAADGEKAIGNARRAVVTSGVGKARVNEAFKRRAAQKAKGELGGTTDSQEQAARQNLIDAIAVATRSRNQRSQALPKARTALKELSRDSSVRDLVDAAQAALSAQMTVTEIEDLFTRLADRIPVGPEGTEKITRADVLSVRRETAQARRAANQRAKATWRQKNKPRSEADDQMDD